MAPLEIFRVIAPEFAGIDEETVTMWLDLTAPLVSRKRFGKVYAQALALLTAHRMKITNAGLEPGAGSGPDELGGLGAAFKIASYSSGGESISFNSGALVSKLSSEAEYAQTDYGVQYLTLHKLYAISIISSGEGGR